MKPYCSSLKNIYVKGVGVRFQTVHSDETSVYVKLTLASPLQ